MYSGLAHINEETLVDNRRKWYENAKILNVNAVTIGENIGECKNQGSAAAHKLQIKTYDNPSYQNVFSKHPNGFNFYAWSWLMSGCRAV